MSYRALAVLLVLSLAAGLAPFPAARASPGDLVTEVTVPVTAPVGVGIAFDGTTFYYTNNGDPTLYGYTLSCVGTACTPTLTVAITTRTATNTPVQLDSVTWDSAGSRMFAANGQGIWQLDPSTGLATLLFYPNRCLGYMDGLAYDAIEDVIYFSPDATSNEVCKFRPDGTLVGAIAISSIVSWPSGCGNSGLAVGGDQIYFGTAHCGAIVRSDKATRTSTGIFSSPGGRDEDLECDPVTFPGVDVIWSKDAYNNKVTAFQIEDNTCGLGGQPPCTGEASILIRDPEDGYDYVGATKTPQSPVLSDPRVSGVVPVRADVASPYPILEVRFYADNLLLGIDTAAPYEALWDTTLSPAGLRDVRVQVKDTSCTTVARQGASVFCGTPLDLAITRPAPMKRYFDDAESPGSMPAPLVLGGPLTLAASASDPGRVATLTWYVDNVAIGIGSAPGYAATWSSQLATPGDHVLMARFHDNDPRCSYDLTRPVRVAVPEDEAIARAVWAAAAQPAELVVRSEGASGNEERTFFDYLPDPAGPVRARVLREIAETVDDATTVRARSVSIVEQLELLGGRITADLLVSEANATLAKSTFAITTTETVRIVGLRVDGQPVDAAPGQVVDVPGVGRLALGEVTRATRGEADELSVAALHLYGAVDGFRGEVVLARAIAGVAADGQGFVGETHRLDAQDDAGTGSDVGGTKATALPLSFATGETGARAVGGRIAEGDVDVYRIEAREGLKLHADLKPAEVAHVRTHQLTMPPSPATIPGTLTLERVDLPDLSMRLVHETLGEFLASQMPLSLPERIELNVNVSGPWYLVVEGARDTNYTLDVSVTPVALLEDVTVGTGCGDASAPLLTLAPTANAMRGTRLSHWYQMATRIGDDVTVALALPDADGADLDLALYDSGCTLLRESRLGKPLLWDGDSPKGLPDAVDLLPSERTETLWVEVTRYVGAGNYALQAQSNTVLPDLPQNDALTGTDASDDAATPTPLGLPAGAWEGRFEDGDPRDAYSFELPANARAVVAFAASPMNRGTMAVLDATGADVTMRTMQNAGYAAEAVLEPASVPRTIVLVFTPTTGGGNYAFTVAQTPR